MMRRLDELENQAKADTAQDKHCCQPQCERASGILSVPRDAQIGPLQIPLKNAINFAAQQGS